MTVMSKMTKLYALDIEKAKTLNIGQFNPTCKAILKAMYKMQRTGGDDFVGSTGEAILQYAAKNGLWFTRQAPEKFNTTWAYYVKKLKDHAHVIEVGSIKGPGGEEYLDGDEFLDEALEDEPAELEEEEDTGEVPFAQAAE
jgi:hypothetical protein